MMIELSEVLFSGLFFVNRYAECDIDVNRRVRPSRVLGTERFVLRSYDNILNLHSYGYYRVGSDALKNLFKRI